MVARESKLAGEVHVVTGGASGIGKATALMMAREGASVALIGRTFSRLESAAAEIHGETGTTVLPLQADVGVGDDVERAFRTIAEKLGPIDVLLNNAGTESFGAVDELAEEKWDDRQATNLKAYFLTAKAALTIGGMKQRRKGLIINTASTLVRASHPGWAAHVAFKHGALGFTQSLQKEVAAYDVRVTLLCPGIVSTDWALGAPVDSEIRKVHANPGYITAEDVAEVTMFVITRPPNVNIGEISVFDTGRRQ